MKTSDVTTGLPAWAKGVIAVSVTAAALFGGFKLYKLINSIKLAKDASKKTINEYEKEIDKTKLSYSEAQYRTMADVLFQAMDGGGTTWPTISSTIAKIKTKDDWAKLVSVFGNKKNTSAWYKTDFEGNLMEWLEDELDDTERAKVSNYLKTIGVVF